ncbi:MAG: adenylate/guanylate cyclase domain-containing protein [Oscillatoria sp. PMC 1051.18]|nr:adenylate/guanylate cyclase domain-containing protein [Oscillatoria sp. PMC 1050.18]MEC5032794.1 adenylate/guanylate cyclase domain-containing protein [Oscillatoria sp. PMC 1051.18]
MLKSASNHQPNDLDLKLNGSRWSAFISELLTNSGHFLVLNSLAEIAIMNWQIYLTDPAHYIIFFALLFQAWYLSRPQADRFWGNLIGAAIYTIVDLPIDGSAFFYEANHWILWLFALFIAILQGLRFHWATWLTNWLIPFESLARMGMLISLYLAVRFKLSLNTFIEGNSLDFLATPEQQFLVESLIFVGLLLGLQTLQVTRQQQQLQETAQLLRNLAEWGMGSYAVSKAVTNPQALNFQRCDRAIVFMDIRGFTHWCEQTAPDLVAKVLNSYYHSVEPTATAYQPLRITLTADEIMAIYATPELAVNAAIAMQQTATPLLATHALGAGCAVHCGTVIEGFFGSEDVRTYTAIGDAVNTAKRLESATKAGEITISDAVYQLLREQLTVESRPAIIAKGKTDAIEAWRLLGKTLRQK